jgi:hypothetical protein
METIRIGHMMGPPALKFRMKKFELAVDSAGAGLASGAIVAVTAGEATAAGEVAVAGVVPGAPGTAGATVVPASGAPGTAGAAVVPGAAASGAPGAVVAAGAVVVSGAAGTAGDAPISAGEAASGEVAGGADGACAKAVSAMVTEHRLTSSVFFIVGRLMVDRKIAGSVGEIVYHKANRGASSKTFQIFSASCSLIQSPLAIRIYVCFGM